MKKLTLIFSMVFLTLGIAQCKGKDDGGELAVGSKKVTIAYPNWAAEVAITHLAKIALDDHGYETKIMMLEPGPIYASLAKGDVDLLLGAWLPNTHVAYWDEYGENIDKIGMSYAGGTTGLVVPAYVEEKSIEDLIAAKDKYNSEIVGIGSGAGIYASTERAIKEYNLPFTQITSSGPAMFASLEKAVNQNKAVVVTGWEPHYMWDRFELRYLEDPKKIYPLDSAMIVSRKGFTEDQPELANFFENFFIEDKYLYDLMEKFKEADDELKVAEQWYNENKDYMLKMWE